MVVKRRRQVNAERGPRLRGRFVFGLHPVREHLLRSGTDVAELWLAAPSNSSREELARLASAGAIPVHHAAPAQLDALCGSENHQGAVAALREFAYADVEDLAAAKPDLLVAADGIEDPRNLGAMIRAIAAAGAGGLIVPRDRAAQVTPLTEKAAAGVTAFLPIARVTNLARALVTLKEEAGYWAVALAQDGERSLYDEDLPRPLVLVVGGETGIRPLVRSTCDLSVHIPMAAGVESLNVSVATAVACFELRRRLVDRTGVGW